MQMLQRCVDGRLEGSAGERERARWQTRDWQTAERCTGPYKRTQASVAAGCLSLSRCKGQAAERSDTNDNRRACSGPPLAICDS